MAQSILQRGLTVLMRRQTNILSAALVIMTTVILSQILGLIRQRLLGTIFGASNTLGIYFYSSQLPDTIFQLTISAALSSSFIPVFSEYLAKGKNEEAHHIASTLLTVCFSVFLVLSLVLGLFAPFFLQIFNLGSNFSLPEITLMANLMRIIIAGQLLFIIGTFFTALLQSYNHFFIPGIAAATYNLGIIIGILLFSSMFGIYAAPIGVVLGSIIFVIVQLPLAHRVGFRFKLSFDFINTGVKRVFVLMWPRTISIVIFQLGTIALAAFISYLVDPGRMNVIFDFARTLAFAPTVLFGQTIAQAAFPVLSRERENLAEFQATFLTSFLQMLYIILPFSILFLVLRIPIVRLAYGASAFDWQATVLTGRTLAFFSLAIFAQGLLYLVARGYYALQDTKTPLIVGAISTVVMIVLGYIFVIQYHLGVTSIAFAYSIANILQLVILMIVLDKKVGRFNKMALFSPLVKILVATICTGFALYIPIKLLDQLVFDTTRTINLLMLTGISTCAGLGLYVYLTWLFNVKEAKTFILLFKKVGNWREILGQREEVIEPTTVSP